MPCESVVDSFFEGSKVALMQLTCNTEDVRVEWIQLKGEAVVRIAFIVESCSLSLDAALSQQQLVILTPLLSN